MGGMCFIMCSYYCCMFSRDSTPGYMIESSEEHYKDYGDQGGIGFEVDSNSYRDGQF